MGKQSFSLGNITFLTPMIFNQIWFMFLLKKVLPLKARY